VNRKRVIWNKPREQTTGTNDRKQGEKSLPQYLVANYLPDDFDPATVTEAMIEEIHALNAK
jgi:hypothetical protein